MITVGFTLSMVSRREPFTDISVVVQVRLTLLPAAYISFLTASNACNRRPVSTSEYNGGVMGLICFPSRRATLLPNVPEAPMMRMRGRVAVIFKNARDGQMEL